MVRLRHAVTLAGAIVLFVSFMAEPAPSAAASGKIAFGTPTIVDPIHTFGEPDLGIDAQGRVFSSGPTGTGTQRSVWLGSVDGGQTFRTISPGPPPSALSGTIDPPGGGDTDLNFDRGGRQYFTDLYALTCLRVATTGDGGASVQQNVYPGGCSGVPGADRPWLAVYDPAPGAPHQSAYTGPTPLVYQEFNNLLGPWPDGGATWTKSLDGLNYSYANADTTPATEATYSPFGSDGYPAIDQQTGKVFEAAGLPNAGGTTHSLLLNVGTPDSLGDLSFLDKPDATHPNGNADHLIHIADNLPGPPDVLFTVLSMDTARNLFVTWAIGGDTPSLRQVFVSAASAATGWTTWTKPIQVSDGSTATGDAVNVFPWIKAGGPGRADAVWYGSDKNVDPSSHNQQAWNVFMSQVVFPTDTTGAITGAKPSTALVQVSPHPMHYDDICLQGSGCVQSQGNRNLADFFEVTIDQTGAAEIVYDDTSNGLVQPGFTPDNQQLVDHAGAPLVTVARQSSGPGLYGTAVSGSPKAPVTGLTDPSGDALYPVIGGTNVAGMDVVGTALSLSKDRRTLTVTTKVADLSDPAATVSAVPGTTSLQYVTRWQMGNTIFFAAMQDSPAAAPTFYAGRAQSVDLCSVSACFPHVLTYPEPGFTGGSPETGSLSCPAAPSATNPCVITIKVNTADVGSPAGPGLLEEVGSYAMAASHPQGATTNAQALADNVPLEVDGVCCWNFR
jgi:hypothetical protein